MEDVRQLIDRCAKLAGNAGARVETLHQTSAGDVVGISLQNAESAPWVYISSGIHGDEPSGPQALEQLLGDGLLGDLSLNWLICPVLNPLGLAAHTREKPNGRDLNRDYFQCRTPEVCAHISWLKKQPVPDLFLSLHEDWESTGIYLYEINSEDCDSIAKALLAAASPYFAPEPERVIDDHDVREEGWIYHGAEPDLPDGWPEAIWVAKHGCPLSYTLETPSSQPIKKRVACHKAMVLRALELLKG